MLRAEKIKMKNAVLILKVSAVIFIHMTALFIIHAQEDEVRGSISLEITGFRNNKGNARILIFSEKEKKYFPSDHNRAYGAYIISIEDERAELVLEDLPYGSYAISVHHDENEDGRVNTNLFGIPREGLGATNDAKGKFGPPSFDKAVIFLKNESIAVKINMVYQ